jgi:putative cofactor-binding repeat protein
VLDATAKSLQVPNLNKSKADGDKLRVFHVEGGRLLEFNKKLGEAVVSGNTIVLLRAWAHRRNVSTLREEVDCMARDLLGKAWAVIRRE